MNGKSGCFWFIAIVIGLVIIGFAANQDDGGSDEEEESYSSDSVKTYRSHETTNPKTLSSPAPNTRVQSFPPYPLLGSTPQEAYEEGYDDGYEQGKKDGENDSPYEIGYDDSNNYDGDLATQYEEGYEFGYDQGYNEGHSHFQEEQEDDD